MARMYAKVVGLVVLLTGIIGLFAGDQLLGVFNIELAEDIIHLGSGALLAYAGFALADIGAVRKIVGAVGVVYLIVGILGFVIPKLLGLLPEVGLSVADNLLHLVLGLLGIVAARDVKDSAPARRTA